MEMKYYLLLTHFKSKSKFILFILLLSFYIFFVKKVIADNDSLISGYYFAEPSTQKIQDDDFINPGIFWVEQGMTLWNKKHNKSDLSCNSCHGSAKEMKGVSLKYPKVLEDEKKLINLEQRINICRKKMRLDKYKTESKELLSLSTLISYQSRGLKFNYKVTEKNKKWYDLGEKLYYKKIGLMGLSCNQCHDDRVGYNLRAEKISQGHINGFPSYLLRWSKVVSVHKRIEFCNEQARAIPYEINSEEYNALQLFLSSRGNGLFVESPAVRK